MISKRSRLGLLFSGILLLGILGILAASHLFPAPAFAECGCPPGQEFGCGNCYYCSKTVCPCGSCPDVCDWECGKWTYCKGGSRTDCSCDCTGTGPGACCMNWWISCEEKCLEREQPTPTPMPTPTCTGMSAPSCINTGGTFTISALGVQNATSVKFPTWDTQDGQEDIVWYDGSQSGSTWSVTISQSAHPKGNINVHVYMFNTSHSNVWCDGRDNIPLCLTPPPTCTLTANPSTGTAPLSGTLEWRTTNSPTSCTASGSWSGSKNPAGGSEGYGPLSAGTYTYNLSCSNTGGTGTCSTPVTANPPTPTPTEWCKLSANPNPCTIPAGGSQCTSTISWSSNTDINVYAGSSLFSINDSGSQGATWITASGITFYGKKASDGTTLCSVFVYGSPTVSPGVQSCVCNWQPVGCGGGSCKPSQMYRVRTCKWSSY